MQAIHQEFNPGRWLETIDVADFIRLNYTPYSGDESFLAPATERTQLLNAKYNRLRALELELGGVLDIDTTTVSSLTNYPAGYLDRELELIVGLQTDAPLKRAIVPNGGLRMVQSGLDQLSAAVNGNLTCLGADVSRERERRASDGRCHIVDLAQRAEPSFDLPPRQAHAPE